MWRTQMKSAELVSSVCILKKLILEGSRVWELVGWASGKDKDGGKWLSMEVKLGGFETEIRRNTNG
jgi:hypothetical protein